ncbi:hypothetical protein DFJ77DRAFT_477862 [Powellomyces hirtus]|nr:hypothetical protein DFJ77DRAFT_477862 [Powellomyces hirtus]
MQWPASQVRPTQCGHNHTLNITVSRADGIVGSRMQMGGTVNAASICDFMTENVFPALEGCCLNNIIDNAPVNRGEDNTGHKLFRLPKYTPYLNCAEWVFCSVKPMSRSRRLSRGSARTAFQGKHRDD